MTRVLYLHGLESGPNAGNVLALRAAGFDVTAPQLDTSAVIALRGRGVLEPSAYAAAMEPPVEQALAALEAGAPDVIVGSSFGGAVLLELLHRRDVPVPVVFLAGAGLRLTARTALPAGVRALLVHARQDDVVPCADSRALAATNAAAVLVEVNDDHRLQRTTQSGLLAKLVALAL